MKLIAYWVGTDALTLNINPPGTKLWHFKLFFYRLKWRLIHRFFEHWAVHENLLVHLNRFGIKGKVKLDHPDYKTYPLSISLNPVEKIPHDTFNVLYYRPKPCNLGGQRYIDWYYGYDLYTQIKENLKELNINFIEADGSKDVRELYVITDIYIRPNRWDGLPRMNLECKANKIPYLWCEEMKDGILNPTVEYFIDEILKVYKV